MLAALVAAAAAASAHAIYSRTWLLHCMYHVTLDFRRSSQFALPAPLPALARFLHPSAPVLLWHFSCSAGSLFALLFFATFLIWTLAQHATKSSSVVAVAKICGWHLIKSAQQLSLSWSWSGSWQSPDL